MSEKVRIGVLKLGNIGTATMVEFLLDERKIAKFKLPERVELIDALPLTNVGKVNKKGLREIIAAKIAV